MNFSREKKLFLEVNDFFKSQKFVILKKDVFCLFHERGDGLSFRATVYCL